MPTVPCKRQEHGTHGTPRLFSPTVSEIAQTLNWTAFARFAVFDFGVEKWVVTVYETAALPSELRWRTVIIAIFRVKSTGFFKLGFKANDLDK